MSALLLAMGLIAAVPAGAQQVPGPPATQEPAAATIVMKPRNNPDWPLQGALLVGGIVGYVHTLDHDIGPQRTIAPFFRPNSRRRGFSPTFGFGWYDGELSVPVRGADLTVGTVHVRPVMAGVGYSFFTGRRLRTTVGLLGGMSFNKVDMDRDLPAGTTASVSISKSFVAGPKADVIVAAHKRLALVASWRYVFAEPNLTVRVEQSGADPMVSSHRVRAGAFTFRIGMAVSVF